MVMKDALDVDASADKAKGFVEAMFFVEEVPIIISEVMLREKGLAEAQAKLGKLTNVDDVTLHHSKSQ
ncbi:uncharacterized protein A4U43_C04F28480 [Asparagus officinalis]|uniref:Uncharacterized protein n=1 Tax=Asparagus officinalis TaxID=4686 RepID=A0A5P1F4B8_ASPOF|nr:uncharacterized protein A4U43_C04F28480 [Asparagus officinalis]